MTNWRRPISWLELEKGDKVEVQWHDGFRPGTLVDTWDKGALVEMDAGGRLKVDRLLGLLIEGDEFPSKPEYLG